MRTRPAPLLVCVLAAACYEQPELSESWQLDRLRVLGVRAEPAEPQPGEDVSFEALVWSPDGAEVPTIWFACLPESADEFGCEIDPALAASLEGLDPETMTDEELAALFAQLVEAGLIGATPYLQPSWTAPADALDGLDEIAAKEGVSALVTLQAVPEGAEDEDDVELAYKRVPISLADTPNHNPEFELWTVSGEDIASGGGVSLSAGETVSVTAGLLDGSVEDYDYTAEDGSIETRTEEPYFTWYATGGEFENTTSLWPTDTVSWTAPAEAGTYELIVTVRDRRGGMAWATLDVTIP